MRPVETPETPPRAAMLMDPLIRPSADIGHAVFYVIHVLACRAFVFGPLPLAITWSPLGTGSLWLSAYLLRPGGRRGRRVYGVLAFLTLCPLVARACTGMSWPVAALESCADTAGMTAACLVLARLTRGRRDRFSSGLDVYRMTIAAFVGALTCCALFLLPWSLLHDQAECTGWFYLISTWTNLCYGTVPGAMLMSDFRPRRLAGIGMRRALLVSAAVVGLMVFVSASSPPPVLGAVIVIVSVAAATFFAPPEALLYLNLLGFAVAVLSYYEHSPFGGVTVAEQSAYVHLAVFLVALATMVTVADRKGRAELLAQVRRERSSAVQQARAAELHSARVEAIMTTMSEGLLLLDADGRVEAHNVAAERLVGAADGSPLPDWSRPVLAAVFTGSGAGSVLVRLPDDPQSGRPSRLLAVQSAPLSRWSAPVAVVVLRDETDAAEQARTPASVGATDGPGAAPHRTAAGTLAPGWVEE